MSNRKDEINKLKGFITTEERILRDAQNRSGWYGMLSSSQINYSIENAQKRLAEFKERLKKLENKNK